MVTFLSTLVLVLFFARRSKKAWVVLLASASTAWLLMSIVSAAFVYFYSPIAALADITAAELILVVAPAVIGVLVGLVTAKFWDKFPEKIRGAL